MAGEVREPGAGERWRVPLPTWLLICLGLAVAAQVLLEFAVRDRAEHPTLTGDSELAPWLHALHVAYLAVFCAGAMAMLERRRAGLYLLSAAFSLSLVSALVKGMPCLFHTASPYPAAELGRAHGLFPFALPPVLWTAFLLAYLVGEARSRGLRRPLEEQQSEGRPPVVGSARVLAVATVAWGCCDAISCVILMIPDLSSPFLTPRDFLNCDRVISFAYLAGPALLGAAAVAGGFGLLRLQSWGRWLVMACAALRAMGQVTVLVRFSGGLRGMESGVGSLSGWQLACDCAIAALMAAFQISYLCDKSVTRALSRWRG